MKNRLFRAAVMLIAALLALSLCACGKDDGAGSPQSQNGASAAQSGFVFSSKGVAVTLKEDAAPVIAALGEPASYFEAESCAFKGLDKTYTYPEFVITTYPDGETDRILSIRLTTDTVSTAEGVSLGDTLEKVTSVYGPDYTQDANSCIYSKGSTKLTFIFTDNTVSSISYSTDV